MFGRRPAEQEAEDHDHCQATGNAQVGLQQQPQTCQTCTRTAQPGHGPRHARRPSLVPEQVLTPLFIQQILVN